MARLLLKLDKDWKLEATLDSHDITVMQSQPIDLDASSHDRLPLSLLRFMVRTAQPDQYEISNTLDKSNAAAIVLPDLSKQAAYAQDLYVIKQTPRSLSGFPS